MAQGKARIRMIGERPGASVTLTKPIHDTGCSAAAATPACKTALRGCGEKRQVTRLEELTPGAMVHGLVPGEPVTVVALRWAEAPAPSSHTARGIGQGR